MEYFLKVVAAVTLILISQASRRVGWPAAVYSGVVAGFAVYAGMAPAHIVLTTLTMGIAASIGFGVARLFHDTLVFWLFVLIGVSLGLVTLEGLIQPFVAEAAAALKAAQR